MDKVSVVTVVYNDVKKIENTVNSVISQSYNNKEFIIVDGGSNDGTLEIIKKYDFSIDSFISEKDRGIYDAMNKGVSLATGEWIIFMNSGDCFVDNKVLENIFRKEIPAHISFIYSDFYDARKKSMTKASFEGGLLLHQNIIYRRKKHSEYGFYAVTDKYIVSDYLFFLRFKNNEVMKTDTIIAVNEDAGASNGKWCVLQRLCCDYLFRRISFTKLIVKLLYWNFRFVGKI